MGSFQVNGTDPPESALPVQVGYMIHKPQPVAIDGLGRPVAQSSDQPWLQMKWKRMDQTGWNWWCAFLEDHKMFGHLNSVQYLDLYNCFLETGPQWVTCTADSIYMEQPKYGAIDSGFYFDVEVIIRGLEEG
jgi:hypothetical protein